MSDVVLTSGKPSGTTTAVEGTECLIDPTFGALRITTRPLEFAANGRIMGHYALAAATGGTNVIAGGGVIFSFRWTDSSSIAVVYRVEVNAGVTAAFTLGQPLDCDLIVARAFTASDTGGTALTPTGQSNKMRTGLMTSSLLADARIATTAALGAGTKTLDAQALGIAAFAGSAAGSVGTPTDLIFTAANGEHPLVLAANEGFNLRIITTQGAAGAVKYYVRVNWAETPGF